MEVHLLPAISADDFPLEQVDKRCPDFLGFLHTRLASLRSRLEDVLQNGGVDVYQVSDGEKTILFPLAPGVELERDLEHGVIRVSAARLKEVAVHV